MRKSLMAALAATLCFAFAAPASAQFTGGVFVATGDIDGASAAQLRGRLSSAKLRFQAGDVTFGASRSATPPSNSGPGIAHVRVINGAGDAASWFQRGSNRRTRADGNDLLIVNNGDGSDFAAIVFTDVIVSSYQSAGSSGAYDATVRYSKINVVYTVQNDDYTGGQ